MPTPTSHVFAATSEQITQLRAKLEERGWSFAAAPHAHWTASKDKTSVAAYQSGKVTVQGRGTAELVQFVIEPEILKEARFGYEAEVKADADPAMLEPHAGIDESGKGDYFGPLVIAAAYVDPETALPLLKAGVADSKTIKSDRRIYELEGAIRGLTRGRFSVVAIGPEAYNRLYKKFGNVNSLLAWGHARALENLLALVPDCPRALSDKFGAEQLIQRALLEKGRTLKLDQRTKAESDVAVAAASILARAEFIRRLAGLGAPHGFKLHRGAGPQVTQQAGAVFAKGGMNLLGCFAKLHFKTTDEFA